MFTKRTLIGLDIGHHTVRAVALRQTGNRYQLLAHAAIERRDAEGMVRPMAVALGEIDSLMNFSGPACVSISDLAALVRYVATIPLPPERLARLLRLELLQTLDGGELAADTFAVPLAGDEIIHCCVLVQPPQVYDALKELKTAGIAPGRIHFAPMAMYNSTVVDPPVVDEEIALLVDIGAQATGVALFGERRLLACRQLAIGGDTFTAALTGPTTSAAQAEQLKCVGQPAAGAPAAPSAPSASPEEPAASGPPSAAAPEGASQARAATSTSINTGALSTVSSTSLLFDDQEPLVLSEEPPPAPAKLLEIADEPLTSLQIDAPWLDHDNDGGVQAATPASAATPSAPVAAPDAHAMPSAANPVVAAGPPESEDFVKLLDEGLQAPGTATMAHARVSLGPELSRVAESLYAQLASSVAWFKTQIHARNLTVTKVFLVGGGAGLQGLDGYLERRFGVPVTVYDPLAAIDGAVPERGYEWATAIGLALSSARGAVSLDLTPDQLLRRQAWTNRLVWPLVAAACLLMTGIFTGWTLLDQQAVDRESLAAYALYHQEYDKLKGQLDELQAEKEGLSEDLRSVASRLYAGRDLLYTVRALKERTLLSKELWITKLETVDISQDAAVREPTTATHSLGAGAPAASKGARHDSAIDRGAVDVTGFVNFGSAPKDTQLNAFFEDYKNWVADWRPAPDAPPLFRPQTVRVLRHLIEPNRDKAKPVPGEEEGKFPFELRFYFQPTELAQITSEREAQAVPQSKQAPQQNPQAPQQKKPSHAP